MVYLQRNQPGDVIKLNNKVIFPLPPLESQLKLRLPRIFDILAAMQKGYVIVLRQDWSRFRAPISFPTKNSLRRRRTADKHPTLSTRPSFSISRANYDRRGRIKDNICGEA